MKEVLQLIFLLIFRIDFIGNSIRREIICQVHKSKYYDLLSDTIPEFFTKNELLQIIGCGKINDIWTVKERFVSFINTD
jgi:hypothetical protein